MQVKFKLWVENDDNELLIGEGLLRLLLAINETGSISKASEKLNMSYRTAWGKLKKLEDRIGYRLIDKQLGGKSGGGTTLTKEGEQLLINYQDLINKTENFVKDEFQAFMNNCDLCNDKSES